jgi:hypothetical protein
MRFGKPKQEKWSNVGLRNSKLWIRKSDVLLPRLYFLEI